MPSGLLAKAESDVKSMVRPCQSASCFGRFRVAGLEYDTGGCMEYEQALTIAREAHKIGVDEWRRSYAINLDGSRRRYR